jgi:hypothetical protein
MYFLDYKKRVLKKKSQVYGICMICAIFQKNNDDSYDVVNVVLSVFATIHHTSLLLDGALLSHPVFGYGEKFHHV